MGRRALAHPPPGNPDADRPLRRGCGRDGGRRLRQLVHGRTPDRKPSGRRGAAGERLDASGREVRRGAARRFAGAAQRRHAHRLSALFGDERRVEVDGEAYFEVEHDARRPFVVVTGQVVSTVLGTTFNVHAYSEDENYQITLATGSLLVDGGPESRSVRLRPGEQGFFERTSGLLSLRRVNVEQVLSWQEDRLYFRAEPLASIARSLARQFNVDITIPDERLRRICFTGEFVDGENIHEIMRIISADSRILCRSRKNHFELYRNR